MRDQSLIGYHQAVIAFKKNLIRTALATRGGNRTRTAYALGIQRTYLVRLIKLFQIDVPHSPNTPTTTRDC